MKLTFKWKEIYATKTNLVVINVVKLLERGAMPGSVWDVTFNWCQRMIRIASNCYPWIGSAHP